MDKASPENLRTLAFATPAYHRGKDDPETAQRWTSQQIFNSYCEKKAISRTAVRFTCVPPFALSAKSLS